MTMKAASSTTKSTGSECLVRQSKSSIMIAASSPFQIRRGRKPTSTTEARSGWRRLLRRRRTHFDPIPVVTICRSHPHHHAIQIFMVNLKPHDLIFDYHRNDAERFLLSLIRPSFLPKPICPDITAGNHLDWAIQATHRAFAVDPTPLSSTIARADRRHRG
ncbi:hypothetical protein ACLOJK_018735 [Asimina triloba]